MDLIFLLAISGALWVQSWYLLGFYPNPRTLGVMAAGVAIVLLAVVIFPVAPIVQTPAPGVNEFFVDVPTALSAFILMWVVYEAMVAGVYLWGLDTRSLGFYSLILWIGSGVFAVYMFLGGEVLGSGVVEPVSWLLGTAGILLGIQSALLFFYLALQPAGAGEPPASTMRTVTGWFYLVFSVVIMTLAGLLVLGLQPSF
ncbi:MAG: hypothetical protein J4F43_09050 [Dehalococcoidia bacterium]|nr:hypothetical protein [Dehalococcoidia bacterium]